MEVHDEFVPREQYEAFLECMPQVCVEVVLDTDDGVLVAKRENPPRVWFWPGSRLYKGERLTDAAHRVGREELGIDVDVVERLGVYEHRWEETEPTRHTVNVAYRCRPLDSTDDIRLDDQHSEYRFLTAIEPDLHEYVARYLRDSDLV